MPPRKKPVELNPEVVQADLDKVLSDTPDAPEPADDLVRLPGGLIRNGEVVRTAYVRELNGFDEEALSKALASGNIIHFVDVLVARGTEAIGTEPATPELLKNLLIGDRDEIVLAIRKATYGDTVSVERWTCPECSGVTPLSFSLTDDIERKKLENPAEETVFEVELRKGAKAKVRLPNGADQAYLFDDESLTTAQRNSRLLTKCVMSYTGPDGREHNIAARPTVVLELSSPDRQKLVQEISKRQPGPQYNRIKFTHDECGNEVVLALGVADLFRDLILFL